MPDDICSQYSVNCRDHADALKESLLSVAGLSELYKVLADETRIKILYLLSQKELCVCVSGFFARYITARDIAPSSPAQGAQTREQQKRWENGFLSPE